MKMRFLGGLIWLCLLVSVGVVFLGVANTVPSPSQANINWRQFAGTTVRALFVAHPWTKGIEPQIKAFEKLTGIKMEVTVVSEDLFWDKVTTGLSVAKPPFDVLFVPSGFNIYTYFKNGWLQPLDSYLNNPALTDKSWYDASDFAPVFFSEFRMPDGKLYGMPISSEVYIIFYRKDVFKQLGIDVNSLKTMNDWLAVVKKISKETKLYGAVVRGGAIGISDELTGMVYDFWGNLPFEVGKTPLFSKNWCPRFTNPRIEDAIATWAELMKYSPPGVTAYTWYDATTAFAQGLAATYWFDASLFAPIFEDPTQSKIVGKVGYAVVPPTKYGHGTGLWPWGIGISSKSSPEVKKAAWLFIEWATSKYGEQFTAPKTWGPVRMSTLASPQYKQLLPLGYADTVANSLKIAKPTSLYFTEGDAMWRDVINALAALYAGKSQDAVMTTLQKQAIKLVESAGLVKPGQCPVEVTTPQ